MAGGQKKATEAPGNRSKAREKRQYSPSMSLGCGRRWEKGIRAVKA
jgi:hypothetical protein